MDTATFSIQIAFFLNLVKRIVLSTSSPQVTASCEHGRSAIITLRCNPEKGERGALTVPRCVCFFFFYYVACLKVIHWVYWMSLPVCVFSKCPAGTCDGCTFNFLWESSSACPICTEADYHSIEGACKGGMQVGYESLPLEAFGGIVHPKKSNSRCLFLVCTRTSCMYGTSPSCARRVCHSLTKAPPLVKQFHYGWRLE